MRKITLPLLLLVSWSTASAQNTFPTPTGNVGIGTTSPGKILEVQSEILVNNPGSRGNAGLFLDRGIEGKDAAVVGFGENGNYAWYAGLLYRYGTASPHFFINQTDYTYNSEGPRTPEFTINTNGNVGIGTEYPNSKLVVNGKTRTNGLDVHSTINVDRTSTRGDAKIFLDRGTEGRDRAVIGFGENGNYGWYAGLLYRYGSTTPHFFINRTDYVYDQNGPRTPEFTINTNGNVGIGVEFPSDKLTVDGRISSEEVKVEIINGPDYVFEPNYELRTLRETKEYISAHKHLPEIPSAKEMEANGVQLGELNMLLLKKIEELTLYTIEQEKKIQQLAAAKGQAPSAQSLEKMIEELTLHTIDQEQRIDDYEITIEHLRKQLEAQSSQLEAFQNKVLDQLNNLQEK